MWIRHVLRELGLVQNYPTEFRCDNHSEIHLAYNSMYHSKTKKIEIDTHYNQDLVVDSVFYLEYFSIEKKVSDIFTKDSKKNRKKVYIFSLLGKQ